MADQIPRFHDNNSPGITNQVNIFNQNNSPGVSNQVLNMTANSSPGVANQLLNMTANSSPGVANQVLNMTANSSPGVANQVLQMITDLASQLQQQSAQQAQGVDFGSDNLVMRSQSRLRGSSSLGFQRPKTRRGTPTSLERQGLFLGQTSRDNPGRNIREERPLFPKTFVILSKKFEPRSRMKPSHTELVDLTDAGLGEVVVQLQEDDTENVVLKKLETRCPLLKDLGGWVIMLKAVSTNSSSMEMIGRKPILSGVDLHKVHARVYVAPLKKDLDFPQKLSFCSVECDDCGQMIDSIYMMQHMKDCSGERRQVLRPHELGSVTSSASRSEFRRQVLRPYELGSGTSSASEHGTPTASGSRGQTALTCGERRQVLRPHELGSSTSSAHGTPTASGSRGQTALTSRTYGSTSGTLGGSSSCYPWQSGDSTVDLDQCGHCGKRIADYFLLLEHIDSCNSSSRTFPPSLAASEATQFHEIKHDEVDNIQECDVPSEVTEISLAVENVGSDYTLNHDGDIHTVVESCSSMPVIERPLDDAKPSTSDGSLLSHMYETEAALQKLEEFRNKLQLTCGSNVLRLNRPYYVKAAVNASQSTQFMASLFSKFVVVFKGEEGVDVGGVRRDFFSHLFHRIENLLIDNRAYMDGEAGPSLSETEYAAGVFFGIAMLQECIYHPAVIELLKTGGPRFVDGLNVFDNLGDFLMNCNSLRFLFKRNPVTADEMIALLRRDENADPNLEMIEKMNFLFICKFFKEVFKGLITINKDGNNQPMLLEDVLQFLTGKRLIAPGDESVIQVQFIKSTEDGFRRPVVSTCALKVTATLAEEYEVMRDVLIEAVAQLVVGFTII